MMPSYALLTKVLDARHTLILDDWLEFLGYLPAEMVIYVGDGAEIPRRIEVLSRKWKVPWRAIPAAAHDDLLRYETPILKRMIETTECEYVLIITLDALPYRRGAHEERWLEEVFHRLQTGPFVFFSACGLIFRGDRFDDDRKYLVTQRFGNNCGLLPRHFWLHVMEKYPKTLLPTRYWRFHSEWAIETALREEGLFGLRRWETLDWRVFHVQQWNARLFKTRELFRRGMGVLPYLNRVWEDLPFPAAEFYNYPRWLRLRGWITNALVSLRRRARKSWAGS